MLGILAFAFVLNSWFSHANHSVLGYATNVNSQLLLADTNTQRASQNEPALHINSALTAAAQAKANDMAAKGYWSHVSPDGTQPWSFIESAGYNYQAAGENLAYGFGTSEQVVSAWMNSPEHRANVLGASYQDVGFASANIPNYQHEGPQTVVVALYGTPVAADSMAIPPVVSLTDDAQTVSRLQTVTGASWVQLALAALCGGLIVLFIIRHALAWHKVLIRGEQFALHHPLFDIFLVSAAMLIFLLSPAAGTIL